MGNLFDELWGCLIDAILLYEINWINQHSFVKFEKWIEEIFLCIFDYINLMLGEGLQEDWGRPLGLFFRFTLSGYKFRLY